MKFSPNPQAMDIVGVGFRPTEEELVDFYLKHMLLADDPRVNIIPVIDLCDVEPWDVPSNPNTLFLHLIFFTFTLVLYSSLFFFFFFPVDFKYSNSRRVNRRTKLGFWKPTGADRKVKTWETNTVIGSKKTLVYYQGRVSSGVKSFWVIHEYHALTLHQTKRNFVLCRLMKKHQRTNKGVTDALICDKEKQSKSMISVFENLTTAEEIPSEGTFNGMETIFQETPQAEKYFSPIYCEDNDAYAVSKRDNNIGDIS
ncbi:hypothetical protein VNO78_25001 [Psophocarpus tetragonolobus]|uniref:NAC domain-containing protein n=1 Tax=Psophocarpus tetragonolobus TaxID=3891 RepID=A0AAN9S5N3_PSOTE